jgi:hypothetical protein
MLANILALAVGIGSLALYMVAFFFPEVHRKNDFIWSGVGLFYALILWFCAGRITGAVLLGQTASVALLGWFGWETLTLRRLVTPVAEQTKISTKDTPTQKAAKLTNPLTKKQPIPPTPTPETETIPKSDPKPDIAETSTESVVTPSEQPEIPTVAEVSSEAKPDEIETDPEFTEIIPDQNPTIPTSETNTTESATATEAKTEPLPTTETKSTKSANKGSGFSQLLTPMSGIFSNIKNAIQGKDNKKPDLSKSTSAQTEVEKSTSLEECVGEDSETVSGAQEKQPEPESTAEKEDSATPDIQTETVRLMAVEIEVETLPPSEVVSTSVEEVASQMEAEETKSTMTDAKVVAEKDTSELNQTHPPSPEEIATENTGDEKSQTVASNEKVDRDDSVELKQTHPPSPEEIATQSSGSEESQIVASNEKVDKDDSVSESSKETQKKNDG